MDYKLELEMVNASEESTSKILNIISIVMDQEHSGFSHNFLIGRLNYVINNNLSYDELLKQILGEPMYYNNNLTEKDIMKGHSFLNDMSDMSMEMEMDKDILEVVKAIEDNQLTQQETKWLIDLLDGKVLSPIMNVPEEWNLVDRGQEGTNYELYQNNRMSSIFKYVYTIEGETIEIGVSTDNTVYTDNGGINYFTTSRLGRKQIAFPYMPPEKSEVVYLFEPEEDRPPFVLTDSNTIEKFSKVQRKIYDSITWE